MVATPVPAVTRSRKSVLGSLSIPHPKPHPKNFSSVLSLFVPCHIRLSVYCPVATLGHSVFFIRSKVRIRLAFVRCQWSRSHAQHQVTVIRTTLSSLRIHVSLQFYHGFWLAARKLLVQILEIGKLETLRHHQF